MSLCDVLGEDTLCEDCDVSAGLVFGCNPSDDTIYKACDEMEFSTGGVNQCTEPF